MVDRETGETIEILKSREKEDIIEWLKEYPNIQTITRDRGDCYIQAITEALPHAIQIADRFHLMVNYSDYVRDTIKRLIPKLRTAVTVKTLNNPCREDSAIQKITGLVIGSIVQIDENKNTLIEKAKDLYRNNYSIRSISQILKLNFRTARKYVQVDNAQIFTVRRTFIDYTGYLDDLIEGYRKGESLPFIFRKIKMKGFQGSLRGLTMRFSKLYKGRMERRGLHVIEKGALKPPKI